VSHVAKTACGRLEVGALLTNLAFRITLVLKGLGMPGR
jgi:hypothetical protein